MKVGTNDEKGTLANMPMFVLASILAALRGDEILKMSLGDTRDYCEEAEKYMKHKHVVLLLCSRFKGESSEGCHSVAISALTNSVLKIGPSVKGVIILKNK